MSKIRSIEITFPTEVELTNDHCSQLNQAIDAICKDYERDHPTEVMWPAGFGSKMLTNPLAMSDDDPLEFDDSTYAIDVTVREDYYGENPNNPDREALRRKVAEERQQRKAAAPSDGSNDAA